MKNSTPDIQKNPFIANTFSKLIVLLFILLSSKTNSLMAQETTDSKPGELTGFVVDDEFGEPMEKAVVTIPGTLISVLTDQQGKYSMKLRGGDYFLEVNFPGYSPRKYNISVANGISTPMFIIKLKALTVNRTMQRRLTSFEKKQLFPGVIENISTWKITEQNGNQEFNESFRTIPSTNLLNNGNGYNYSKIGFRGNDPKFTSYALNSILLNNPETGDVSSSIFSGLTDWAEQIQVTTGQASYASGNANYGGLINVLPFLPHKEFGGEVLAVYGNNGLLKTTGTVHSGLSKKGFASSLLISRTAGEGASQNGAFEQYALAVNLQKEFNHRNTIVFNLNTVVQKHDRNPADSIGSYNLYGTKYNSQWGSKDEKTYSWSTNYERSPLISLIHYWQPRIKTYISTQIYAQFNRSSQLLPGGKLISQPIDSISRDDNGHILFNQLIDWNKGINVGGMGISRSPDANGKFINTESLGITTLAAINTETRLGLRSVLNHNITKEADLVSSVNLEEFKAKHFGAINDLLGADSYMDFADINNPSGTSNEKLFNPGFMSSFNPSLKTAYSYESSVQSGSYSIRFNYHPARLFWYIEGNASIQNLKRTDHFNYLVKDLSKASDSHLLPGGHAQTGIRVNLWKYHSVFLHTNYGSYQQRFNVLFPSGNNWKNENAKNEQVLDAELGYTVFSRRLKIEATAYRSEISNRSMIRYTNLNSGNAFGLINGIKELHHGVELKVAYKFTKNFQFNVNGSLGDWKYMNDVNSGIYNQKNEVAEENLLLLKNVKIANAPQLSLYAEAEYRWAHNFYFRLNFYRGDQIYAPFGLYDFKNLSNRSDFEQWRLPAFNLIGISGNYLLTVLKNQTINLIFGGQNLLDAEYIEQTSTNIKEDNPGYTSNMVQYGMGRTWFVGVKYQF